MKLNDCGCCEQAESPVLTEITNDPGLAKIEYRVGRFGQFKQAMKNAMNEQHALSRLTTRDDSDPAIATLDAWSTVLDVLTFYQERIANENYLRTASEYRSVVELGQALGYRLAPGTAATTYVAFKMDDSGHGPESVRIDVGSKIQSQPGQDELPQVYETQEAITAYPEYNELQVQPYETDPMTGSRNSAYFEGSDFDVKIGDVLLFIAGDTIANPDNDHKSLTRVTAIVRDADRKVTHLTWTPSFSNLAGSTAFIMRQRTAIWGYNAIDFDSLPLTLTIGDKNPLDNTDVTGPFSGMDDEWADANFAAGETEIDLESIYPAIVTGSWIGIKKPSTTIMAKAGNVGVGIGVGIGVGGPDHADVEVGPDIGPGGIGIAGKFHVYKVTGTEEVIVDRFMMAGKATRLTLDGIGLSDFSPKTGAVLAQSDQLILATRPITTPLTGNKLQLSVKVDRPEAGRKLLIRGKRPRLQFTTTQTLLDEAGNAIGSLSANELVWLQKAPETQPSGLIRYEIQRADTTTGFTDAAASVVPYLPAEEEDETYVGEVVTVSETQTGASDDPTEIVVVDNLTYAYDRLTSKVFGNVAYATHGETKTETMGSGNASKPFLAFELKDAPLTYLAAATETGYQSTLEVRVNEVLWHETPTLYGEGPKDRVFTARENDKLKTIVRFGDGKAGARTETGVENITAKYRVGSGLAGRVRAEQLNMLLTRPLGVVEVKNPLVAEGGSDGEDTADAQQNIPKSILTLSRIVSVQDFEDHAARYPAIAKAQSLLLWNGTQQVVHLTVSGADGEAVDTTDLLGSINTVRDTHFPVVLQCAELLKFQVNVSVLVKEDYLAENVLPDVEALLTETFSFDSRLFSEAVTVSEILAAVQQVEGVEAALVSVLDLSTEASPIANDVLRILPGRADNGVLLPAQMLVIDPDKIELEEMTRDV